MSSNARLIYESINSYSDISNLIGKQEDLFLDFKETSTRDGGMSDDDKRNYSKAASGFAHSEGGVLVWGINARKNADGVDEAIELKPVAGVKKFFSELQGYAKYSTEPIIDGIEHKIIFENDDDSVGRGFIISFFSKSDSEHRSLGKGKEGFYKRFGDSFVALSTSDIRALFFRVRGPELEVLIKDVSSSQGRGSFVLVLVNKGKGIGKNFLVEIDPKFRVDSWFDGEGNTDFKVAKMVKVGTKRQFMANPGVVIHHSQELVLSHFSFHPESLGEEASFKLSIYAENMPPKEEEIRIQLR